MSDQKPHGHPHGHPHGGAGGGKPPSPADFGYNPEELVDMREKGGMKDGQRQTLDRRLYMQLLVYTGCTASDAVVKRLANAEFPLVIYVNVTDPTGIGLLTWSEEPDFFVTTLRHYLDHSAMSKLEQVHKYNMFGRTYSLGHEADLYDWLIPRSPRVVTDPANKWAVWYPLRRKGEFERLPKEEQGKILMEHGVLGHAFGAAGLGSDIRLACHGLDTNDSDFVIGLIGKELHPLSRLVQTMRSTQQTSRYLERLGPFFIGRAVLQSKP